MRHSKNPISNKPTPNQPDRQREHQANERTFLAWLRTSIALIGFGFALARFGLFLQEFESLAKNIAPNISPNVSPNVAPTVQSVAQPVLTSQTLGVVLAVFGIAVIVLATWRYNQVFVQIERGAYRPSRWAIWLLSGLMVTLALLSLPLLTKRRETNRQSNSLNPAQTHSLTFAQTLATHSVINLQNKNLRSNSRFRSNLRPFSRSVLPR